MEYSIDMSYIFIYLFISMIYLSIYHLYLYLPTNKKHMYVYKQLTYHINMPCLHYTSIVLDRRILCVFYVFLLYKCGFI